MDQEVSYDQLIDEFIQARSDESTTIWRQSAICFFLRIKMGVPAKTVGGDVGLSGRYVTQLAKTFECFPEETDRAMDLSYSHHAVCAQTDDPIGWLEKAIERAWSVRDLKEAVGVNRSIPDPMQEAKRAWTKVEGLLMDGGEVKDYLMTQIRKVQSGSYADSEAPEETQEEEVRL